MKVDADGENFTVYTEIETKTGTKVYVAHELTKQDALGLAIDLLNAIHEHEKQEE